MDTYDRLLTLRDDEALVATDPDESMRFMIRTDYRGSGNLQVDIAGRLDRIVPPIMELVVAWPELAPQLPRSTAWVLPLVELLIIARGGDSRGMELPSMIDHLSIILDAEQAARLVELIDARTLELIAG
jgi:hypothetical protein